MPARPRQRRWGSAVQRVWPWDAERLPSGGTWRQHTTQASGRGKHSLHVPPTPDTSKARRVSSSRLLPPSRAANARATSRKSTKPLASWRVEEKPGRCRDQPHVLPALDLSSSLFSSGLGVTPVSTSLRTVSPELSGISDSSLRAWVCLVTKLSYKGIS